MKIKRFIAKNMREAIRQVREEQGADAVILSNRRLNGGIEVVAAVDYDEALMQQSLRRASAPVAPPQPVERPLAPEPEAVPPRLAAAVTSAGPDRAALDHLLAEFGQPESAPRLSSAPSAPVPEPKPSLSSALPRAVAAAAMTPAFASIARQSQAGTPIGLPVGNQAGNLAAAMNAVAVSAPEPEPVSSQAFEALKSELGGMRRMIEQQLSGLAWHDLKTHRPQRLAVLRAMADIGLEPSLARTIADEIPDATTPERARFLPLGMLARRIPVTKSDIILDGGIVALVGPTGVGKTTTIAKLAARYAERHGLRDIALVAMDHYRIGAQEQLYTYGRLLGVPVYTVSPHQSLADTLLKLADRKLVLIDTMGLSPRDNALAGQVEMLEQAHPKLRAYLVMAANAQAADQDEVVRRFGATQLSGCILSKLDETTRIGGALSVAVRHGLPLAYVTDGQRVPEDIEIAKADQLVIRAMQLARSLPAGIDDETLALQFATTFETGVPLHV